MRRADIVRIIRPLQLALALTPLLAMAIPSGVTHAASRMLTKPVVAATSQPQFAGRERY